MFTFAISITEPYFWLTAILAIVLLNLITHVGVRKWTWVAINLGLVGFLLGKLSILLIGGFLVLSAALRALGRGNLRLFLLTFIAISTLLLFLIHNLGPSALYLFLGEDRFYLDPLRRLLTVVGFSYVALRLVEIVRAVAEQRHPPPDFPSLINYLIPFHMIAAGPIQGYDEYVTQPPVPEPSTPLQSLKAIERIAWGLFKKFVLAATLRNLFLTDFETWSAYTFFEAQVFFLWLYLDFSAYSDIAVGLGQLMGVRTPENFNRPYIARNMIDFWERWHISLSLWIRRNLYIPIFASIMRRNEKTDPLAGSVVAFTLAFIFCGLWHDLSFNFLIWGALHAFGLVVTNIYQAILKSRLGTRGLKAYNANPVIRIISIFITYEFVAFSMLTIFIRF